MGAIDSRSVLSASFRISIPTVTSHHSSDERLDKMWQGPYLAWTLLYLLGLTVFRLWFCRRLELAGDEAYYWLCSRHLALSYFDKGPGAAWTIALGTRLFGDTEFGVRWPAVLLSMLTGLLIYALGRRLFSPRVGFWSVVIASIAPMFAVGSILMTIDPISLFFWGAAALTFWEAKETDRWHAWLLTGVCVGLGALGKYTNFLELLSFALFCGIQPGQRRQFLQPGFYLMLATAFACSLPMIIWNMQHDWVTVSHLAHRGALDQKWSLSPREFGTFLGEQAGVISPGILVGVLSAFFLPIPVSGKPARVYLLTLSLPLFLIYATLSLNHAAQANWVAPAYISGFILMVAAWLPLVKVRSLKVLASVTLAIATVETLLLHDNTSILNLPAGRDPMDRVRGWTEMATGAEVRRVAYQTDFFISNGYQNPSLLSFYLSGHPTVFSEPARSVANQFALWPGYRTEFPPGATALFVSDVDHLPLIVKRDFEDTRRLDPIVVTHGDRVVKSVYFFLCEGLLSPEERR